MKGKWSKCYIVIGTIVILIIAAIGSFAFVKGNIGQADNKYDFESIYVNTVIDFIVPSPSYEQVSEIEGSSETGIEAITPYYETTTSVSIDGSSCSGTTVILPDENKVNNTPYSSSRIVKGNMPGAGQAVVDQSFKEKNGFGIGDTAEITIADRRMSFEIVGVSETNSYVKNGSIALVLDEDDKAALQDANVSLSAAYIKAADYEKCKSYLYNDYKPYGRLKDPSDFSSEDTYNQHLQNFNDADWTKEITNCDANYDSLKIKYENVESTSYRNLIIYAIIIVLAIIAMNIAFLKGADVQKAIKIFIVKSGGTVSDAKKFYSKGIWFNFLEFIIASVAFYYLIASKSTLGLVGTQLLNLCVPVAVALMASLIAVMITSIYTGNKYKLKKSEVVAIKKELGIPLSEDEKY